jgi:hypothetical protein
MPQAARLRCRLQEPRGGLASAFEQRRLTKRSREQFPASGQVLVVLLILYNNLL